LAARGDRERGPPAPPPPPRPVVEIDVEVAGDARGDPATGVERIVRMSSENRTTVIA
jgi:hypothetical protein